MTDITLDLFAMPSTLEGLARMMDFSDSMTEFNLGPEADRIACAVDWYAVGDTLRGAIYQERLTRPELKPQKRR